MLDSNSNNKIKWALDLLRKKSRIAYRNGEIGTVRHLSILALEKINQNEAENNKQEIVLEDSIWAFVFMLICLQDDWEYGILENAYRIFGDVTEDITNGKSYKEQHRPDDTVSPYATILNFVFDVYDCPFTNETENLLDNHYNKLFNLNINNLYELNGGELELEDELLLTLVIEILWYIETPNGKWKKLAKKWIAETNEPIKRIIFQTKERLHIQNLIVRDFNKEAEIINEIKTKFAGQNNELFKLLSLAWLYFYYEDWENIHRIIAHLVTKVSFDSEYFLAVQGLINMTQTLRDSEKLINSKKYDGYMPGYMRYQRVQLSRPAAIVNFDRELSFEKMVFEVKNDPHKTTSKREHMMRLSLILELSALRLWSLGAYLKAIKFKKEISAQLALYFTGDQQYNGYPNLLTETLYWAVKSLNVNPKKQTELDDAKNLLEIKYAQWIPGLIQKLLNTKPIEWPGAAQIFNFFGDAIPFEMLGELARWSQRFLEYPIRSRYYLSNDEMQFWEPIIKYSPLTDEIWRDLEPVINLLLSKRIVVNDSNITFWTTVLIKAPLLCAIQWAKTLGSPSCPIYKVRKNGIDMILFNAAFERKELRTIAIKYLQTNLDSSSVDYDLNLLLHAELNIKEIDSTSYCKALLKYLGNYCNNIDHAASINIQEFNRCNWNSVPISELKSIAALINNTIINSRYIQDINISILMNTLYFISKTAPIDFCSYLISLVDIWINSAPYGRTHTFDGGPLCGFRILDQVNNRVEYSLILLVTELYKKTDFETSKKWMKWAIDKCIYTEDLSLANLGHLFFFAFLTENDKQQAITGLNSILARVTHGSGTKYFIKGLTSIIENDKVKCNISGVELIKSLDKENYNYIKSLLSNILKCGVNTNPDTRMHIAICINAWEKHFDKFDGFNDIKNATKNDPRARVRNIFNS